MEQWPAHSVRGYLKRLPTYKLEWILETRCLPSANSLLTSDDYVFIEQILQMRPDSRLFGQKNP